MVRVYTLTINGHLKCKQTRLKQRVSVAGQLSQWVRSIHTTQQSIPISLYVRKYMVIGSKEMHISSRRISSLCGCKSPQSRATRRKCSRFHHFAGVWLTRAWVIKVSGFSIPFLLANFYEFPFDISLIRNIRPMKKAEREKTNAIATKNQKKNNKPDKP